MNIVQVGLGDFGFSWLRDVLLKSESINIVGLVDKNRDLLIKAKSVGNFDDSQLFTSIEDALDSTKPDFVLNVTPPGVHKTINMETLKRGIPVLSEKPIAESYKDALEIMNTSLELNIPLMISENYRYFNIMRRAKGLIGSGEIGKLNSLNLKFFRNHHMTNYHKDLEYPLLVDVAIHHFDMIRYITGCEAVEVFARQWNPSWSWYKGLPCLSVSMEMENDIKVSYNGSLASPINESWWLADWRIEGSEGVIEISDSEIRIIKEGSGETIHVVENGDNRDKVLSEFIKSLNEHKKGETDITDNIKTYRIVDAVLKSSTFNKPVRLDKLGEDL